jgi:hypothetical protein
MSVQFTKNPQQVVQVEPYNSDEDQQRLQGHDVRVPLDRMTSRLNPYADVQEQINDIQNYSREERAERIKVRRTFDKVRRGKVF